MATIRTLARLIPAVRAARRKSTHSEALVVPAQEMLSAAPGAGWASARLAKCAHGLPATTCPLCHVGGGPPIFPGSVTLATPRAADRDVLHPSAEAALAAFREARLAELALADADLYDDGERIAA